MATSSLSLPSSLRTALSSRAPRSLFAHRAPLGPSTFFKRPICPVPVSSSRTCLAVGATRATGFGVAAASFHSSMAGTEMEEKKRKGLAEVFDSEEELAVSLARYTAELSDKFSKERGAFTVVLSGGSLVKSLRKLVEAPYIDSIEWSKWHVFWVDERVVPKDHDDSNYKLAFDGFLCRVPILPGNVYAINDALSAEGAAEDYETCLKHLVHTKVVDTSPTSGFPSFDLMLMGMGPDGHVASLFPGHPLLNEKGKWVAHITDSPKPPPERITFTFPVINSSSHIALVVCGAGKSDVVGRALGKSQNTEVLPVQMVSPEGGLKWFLDKGAASKL